MCLNSTQQTLDQHTSGHRTQEQDLDEILNFLSEKQSIYSPAMAVFPAILRSWGSIRLFSAFGSQANAEEVPSPQDASCEVCAFVKQERKQTEAVLVRFLLGGEN